MCIRDRYKSSNSIQGLGQSESGYAIPSSTEINLEQMINRTRPGQPERISSFLYTGGLIATHVVEKNRDSLWNSLESMRVLDYQKNMGQLMDINMLMLFWIKCLNLIFRKFNKDR